MQTTYEEKLDRVRGTTMRYTWTEGPTKGTSHEHVFGEDGTVTWRCLDGPQKGHEGDEKKYASVRITDDVYAVSYLASNGYTLTVILNFQDHSLVGFASGAKEWFPCKGTFRVVDG